MGDAWIEKGQLVRMKNSDRVGIVVEVFQSPFESPYGPWYTVYWIASGVKRTYIRVGCCLTLTKRQCGEHGETIEKGRSS